MFHKPIQIQDIALSFPHQSCFEDFSTQITCGNRIGIIGKNGSGKTSLLKILCQEMEPTYGIVRVPDGVVWGYVPQVVTHFDAFSGGERFQAALSQVLSQQPHVLLLDEPTNHLDRHHKNALIRMLRNYEGTLIVVSHDVDVLRACVDILWHIEPISLNSAGARHHGTIRVFAGNYDDYVREINAQRSSWEEELYQLRRQKKETHQALMKEQERAKKSNLRGKKSIQERKWPTVVSSEKAGRAVETAGKKKRAISDKKSELVDKINEMWMPEPITPKFSLNAHEIGNKMILSIRDGCVGYQLNHFILTHINMALYSHDRIVIQGDNGSGKTTLIKAILNAPSLTKQGDWYVPKLEDIGYLDQHYETLSLQKTVFETIADSVNSWTHADIRRHLNDFLFRKNEEVNCYVKNLSGGEKARLSLAQIAAKTPKLLILDEVTNNLDLETREHVIQVLQKYPGAMIIISHDEDFLEKIEIQDRYTIQNGQLLC